MLDRRKIEERLEELDAQTEAFAYSPMTAPGMDEDEILDRIHQIGLDAFQDEVIKSIISEEIYLNELLETTL